VTWKETQDGDFYAETRDFKIGVWIKSSHLTTRVLLSEVVKFWEFIWGIVGGQNSWLDIAFFRIDCIDVWSSDTWSMIGGNASRRDQSHVNIRYEVLDWFGPSHEVIALRPILMYYAIEIDSSIFLSGSFEGFLRMFSASGIFRMSSMWIYPLYL
jgi:hypothetical protein